MSILPDSNVLIAALYKEHMHHESSATLIEGRTGPLIIATHSLAEAYNRLTRERAGGAMASSKAAANALQRLAMARRCRALSNDETLDATRRFAELGGRGARLYDYLIGYVAILEGAHTIATWNTKDFVPLFPALRIATPHELLES